MGIMNNLVNYAGLLAAPALAGWRCWLFAALAMFGAVGAAVAQPQQIDVTYRLSKSGQPFGIARETFRRERTAYRIESVTQASGIFALFVKGGIRLVSSGKVGAAGLIPAHFEHHRGNDPEKAVYADFDWATHAITQRYDGKSETEELPPGCQDRLSQLYQFMFRPPRDGEIELAMSNGRQISRYRYRVVGVEALATPAGRFDALHLSKMAAERGEGVDIWLAKNRGYFPVQVRFEEKDGGTLEQVVESLTLEE